jgi:hypothetical protein
MLGSGPPSFHSLSISNLAKDTYTASRLSLAQVLCFLLPRRVACTCLPAYHSAVTLAHLLILAPL